MTQLLPKRASLGSINPVLLGKNLQMGLKTNGYFTHQYQLTLRYGYGDFNWWTRSRITP